MRVLVDECLDPGIRDLLTDHEITTVGDANWQSTADNRLVELAQGRFNVLLTLDRGFEFQHNLTKLSFGIVIVHAKRNRREDYAPLGDALRQAVQSVRPGQVVHVR